MAPFGQQFSASASPVLTLAPQAAHHQVTPGLRPFSHQVSSALDHSASHHAQPGVAWPAAYSQIRGHKRSRDEAAINLDSSASSETPTKPAQNPFAGSSALPRPQLQSQPQPNLDISLAGFGATPTTAQMQTPLAQSDATSAKKQQDRPILRSHKSQRLGHVTIMQQQTTSTPTSIGQAGVSASGAPGNPVVDDFTLHLGIGWRRISEDIDIQAAARGWARYIENNYPVTCAKMCLESKGLQSYLVEAAEGYFLFSENLREGRLVSRNVEGALCNLKGQTPVFEGDKMVAGQSTVSTNHGIHHRHGALVGHADIEMRI